MFGKLKEKTICRSNWITKFLVNTQKTGKDNRTGPFLKARIQLLERYWAEYVSGYDELLEVANADQKVNEKVLQEDVFAVVEQAYIEASSWLTEQLAPFQTSHDSSMLITSTPIAAQSTTIRLPKIDLPHFNGSYRDWPSFYDTYMSLIQNNTSLTDVQKLHYLKSSITGEASKLLSHLSVTNANYDAAWKILTERSTPCFFNDLYSSSPYKSENPFLDLYGEELYSSLKKHGDNNQRLLVNTNLNVLITLSGMASESPVELRRVIDEFNQSVRALENLSRPVEHWNEWLVYFLTSKLDRSTRKDWETSLSSSTAVPSFEALQRFLEGRLHALNALKDNHSYSTYTPANSSRSSKIITRTHFSSSVKVCPSCKERHLLLFCPQFRAKPVEDRIKFLHIHRLCRNCLRSGHTLNTCPSQNRCKHCHQKHHTMTHQASTVPTDQQASTGYTSSPSQSQVINATSSHMASNTLINEPSVLLATACVFAQSPDGRRIKVRALLDQGSESNFVTSSLANLLRVPDKRTNVTILGPMKCIVGVAKTSVTFDIVSLIDQSWSYTLNCLVMPTLTQLMPARPVRRDNWPHIARLQLADPDFDNPSKIDIIIGAGAYARIIQKDVKTCDDSSTGLLAQATKLGWIVSGEVECGTSQPSPTITCLTTTIELSNFLRKFWETEEPPSSSRLKPDEEDCENHYSETHTRNPDGRYVVRLPLKVTNAALGDTRGAALQSLLQMERRFLHNTELRQSYSQFMAEYLQKNHMELVTDEAFMAHRSCYLPHHAVIKPCSTTTKLRVVFNGSQKSSSGLSLNDILHTGPKLQNDVFLILLKWRLYPFVLAGDIEKMYRQILVDRKDTDLQRILWRFSPDEPIKCYRLVTVTYGTASAPYLACKTLLQLANDYQLQYPDACQVIRDNFYVDDALFGAFDEATTTNLRNQLTTVLRLGGFKLRKWLSNSPSLIADIPVQDREHMSSIRMVSDPQVKTLGVAWCPTTDTFRLNITLPDNEPVTKRTVLADISRLYDPLGWLSPVTITAKIFLQRLWLTKIDWDDELPQDLHNTWLNYRRDLNVLSSLALNRWIGVTTSQLTLELHGFCDASMNAYGAAVYLRVAHDFDNIQVSLIAAKTRVSPLKTVSLPRLELCGATLLSELMAYVHTNLNLDNASIHLWSDSTIVLAWLREHPSKWKVFVANRVALIHEKMPNATWHHIPSTENPADCISRGIPAVDLEHFNLWWSGPPWLRQNSTQWPHFPTKPATSSIQEEIRTTCLSTTVQKDLDVALLHKFSDLMKLLRVTAYCFRFVFNCKSSRCLRRIDALTLDEINKAHNTWIKLVQGHYFTREVDHIFRRQPLPSSSKLLNINPILDNSSLLRVGGRLKNALLNYDEKHPVILPKESYFTKLVILRSHKLTLHGGTQATLHHCREKYWILNGRSKVRQLIRLCVICARYRAKTKSQLMADLPIDRVRPSKPFLHTGVDFAGPFTVKPFKGRIQKRLKIYVALFVCFSTRACHLEMVMDLTSEAFIAALRRFIGRRGRCNKIYSDNAGNFTATAKQLSQDLDQLMADPNIRHLLLNEGIEWHFIPPASPHFGGLWEAGVKSMKYHLRRVVADHTLTIEEMLTLLSQIEACLNSRPLYTLSDDPQDLSALTPGHFLVGESLKTIPTPSTLELPQNKLNRWQLIQQMYEQLWRRWHKEYLTGLQLRNKWQRPHEDIRVNDLVLIKEDHSPPARWSLGRVIQLHPGSDGHVRVVTLRRKDGTCKRPIAKLCLLPVSAN